MRAACSMQQQALHLTLAPDLTHFIEHYKDWRMEGKMEKQATAAHLTRALQIMQGVHQKMQHVSQAVLHILHHHQDKELVQSCMLPNFQATQAAAAAAPAPATTTEGLDEPDEATAAKRSAALASSSAPSPAPHSTPLLLAALQANAVASATAMTDLDHLP